MCFRVLGLLCVCARMVPMRFAVVAVMRVRRIALVCGFKCLSSLAGCIPCGLFLVFDVLVC